jgi:hypothetical protein
MKIEFEMPKLNPTTKVVLEMLPGQPTETETGFIVPIVLPMSDGKQAPIAAIECSLLAVENGVQRIAVSSVQYTADGLGEPILLNHVQIDLKQFVPPTDENEIVLSVASAPPVKAKSA